MKVHETLPENDLVTYVPGKGRSIRPLSELKYGVFFLPENRGKVFELVISPDRRKTVDYAETDAQFRSKIMGYTRPKGSIPKTHPELRDLKVSVRKSASKPDTYYVQVLPRETK